MQLRPQSVYVQLCYPLHGILHVVQCPCKPSMLQIVPSDSKERLAFLARQMDVDILVTGHTHEFKVQRKVSTVITPCATLG